MALVPGYRPSPGKEYKDAGSGPGMTRWYRFSKLRWVIQIKEFPKVKRRFGACEALFVVYPMLWKVGKQHHYALEWSLNGVSAV